MTVLINQMGYRLDHPKTFVVQDKNNQNWQRFEVVDCEQNNSVFKGELHWQGKVANWHTGYYWTGNFTTFDRAGMYKIVVSNGKEEESSDIFCIDKGQTNLRLISALTYYFKGQRDSGEWANVDKNASYNGPRSGTHNVYGGWFDATGDLGIHMSHQTFTSYFNPQQLSFSGYAFFQAYELLQDKSPNYTLVRRHMLDEGSFGADSLMRRYVEDRSFLKSVNRKTAYSLVESTRKIGFELHKSSWQFGEAKTLNSEEVTDLNYETSFRSGGGLGIATLAIAARHSYPGTDFSTEAYLKTAKKIYQYLKLHNDEINNDGRSNLVDEYCALYAAIELYQTTQEYGYLKEAEDWGEKILKRIKQFDGYQYLTVDKDIPYFHPSDEGMPLIGLVKLVKITDNTELQQKLISGISTIYDGLKHITFETSNPFKYPKMTINHGNEVKTQFFFPHQSAASPWWQGENARIASLAVASTFIQSILPKYKDDADKEFVQNQIDWIFGENPFNSTMMEGYGKNPIQYHFNDRLDFVNAPGGVVNGITSGITDENDIAFVTKPDNQVSDNWRWAEQWIPHASWLLVLLSAAED